jgi:two-component system sensor histidine kinase RegB
VVVGEEPPGLALHVPRSGLVRSLANLLRNGLDATDGEVRLAVSSDAGMVRFEVTDSGAGMTPEVLERATDPFFTTKPGKGLGLGLFLARSLADQLGGRLVLRSRPGAGTTVSLEVPS